MIAPLAKWIDRSAAQVLTLLELNNTGQNPRLEEALCFLQGPDFIPAKTRPAPLEFNPDQSGWYFRFPTSWLNAPAVRTGQTMVLPQ